SACWHGALVPPGGRHAVPLQCSSGGSMSPRFRFRSWLPAVALAAGIVLTLVPARSAGLRAQLAQARADAAARAFPLHEAQYRAGSATLEPVYTWSARWFEAQGGKGAGAGPAGEHLKRMQALE